MYTYDRGVNLCETAKGGDTNFLGDHVRHCHWGLPIWWRAASGICNLKSGIWDMGSAIHSPMELSRRFNIYSHYNLPQWPVTLDFTAFITAHKFIMQLWLYGIWISWSFHFLFLVLPLPPNKNNQTDCSQFHKRNDRDKSFRCKSHDYFEWSSWKKILELVESSALGKIFSWRNASCLMHHDLVWHSPPMAFGQLALAPNRIPQVAPPASIFPIHPFQRQWKKLDIHKI